jgi:hypothetical protein
MSIMRANSKIHCDSSGLGRLAEKLDTAQRVIEATVWEKSTGPQGMVWHSNPRSAVTHHA